MTGGKVQDEGRDGVRLEELVLLHQVQPGIGG